jgi:hypothetical protein
MSASESPPLLRPLEGATGVIKKFCYRAAV